MSSTVRLNIEDVISALLEEAAVALRWAEQCQNSAPWRRHDVRIYREQAAVALQAVSHLEGALS
jgi:hypothetical protein